MVLGFAPKEHALTLIENGAFGRDSAMSVSDVASAYDHEVPVDTVRLALKVVRRTEITDTDDGYEAYIAAEVADTLADRLAPDKVPALFGYAPEQYARTLIEMGAFGKDSAVSLSEIAASFDDDVSVNTVKTAVAAIDRATVVQPEDTPEAYIDYSVAADLAERLYKGGAVVQ